MADDLESEYGSIAEPEYHLTSSQVSSLADYARHDARQYLAALKGLDCPPESGLSISAGGGASRLDLPQMPIGTVIVGGEEIAAAKTVNEVDGSSFAVSG